MRNRAAVLPLIGLLLLMPPIARIFDVDLRIGGLPVTLVYLFAVWALLIAGTFAVSRHLGDTERDDRGPRP